MDFQAVFSNIKEKILSVVDMITDFVRENKKKAIIIGSLIVLILVFIVILIVSLSGKKESEVLKMPLVLSEETLLPDGPVIQNDFALSRKTDKAWSEEETDTWFTIPSDKEINSLSKTNNAVINELLGAAP